MFLVCDVWENSSQGGDLLRCLEFDCDGNPIRIMTRPEFREFNPKLENSMKICAGLFGLDLTDTLIHCGLYYFILFYFILIRIYIGFFLYLLY